MSERKLASIRRIDKIEPIDGADKIVKATVGGWQLVTAKDNGFKEGDLCIYLEIDSWVPTEVAPFLSKGHEPREFNGVKGERLKTIKLRGTLSQGLIMPLCYWDGGQFAGGECWSLTEGGDVLREGDDVTELLGIQKWEKPLPAQLAGQTRRYFPSFLRKTDQERCQNLKKEIGEWYAQCMFWEITEKIDGSSMTVYARKDIVDDTDINAGVFIDVGVCSRNLELKLDQEGNSFVDTAKNTGLIDALTRYVGEGLGEIAVQGELYGEGIQGNNEGIQGLKFAVFDIWDIKNQEYMNPLARRAALEKLKEFGADIEHVPSAKAIKVYDDIDDLEFGSQWTFIQTPSDDIQKYLQLAEGKNKAGNEREGIVFKSFDGKHSFKAISNAFLLGGGD